MSKGPNNPVKTGFPCPGPPFSENFSDCGRPVYRGGLCRGHLAQKYRGATLAPLKNQAKGIITPFDRFMQKVDKRDSGCWIWTGHRTAQDGYGRFGFQGKAWSAHRWAWVFYRGQLADGITLDHLCRERLCVNPDHLEPITARENIKRMHFAQALLAELEQAKTRIAELETLLQA